MGTIIVHHSALSAIDMANLREFNRVHEPVTFVVVNDDGVSRTFKLTEQECNEYLYINDIPEKYKIVI